MNARELDVAILHDVFSGLGGSTSDAVEMARYLNAKIVTFNPPDEGFDDIDFIGLGNVKSRFGLREMKIALKYVQRAIQGDFDEYDLVIINQDWPKHAVHFIKSPVIRYCHSPERHLWDLHETQYRWAKENMGLLKAAAFDAWCHFMRPFDKLAENKMDKVLCNSENIQNQIKRYYGLDAEVLYPPVDIEDFSYKGNRDFWLSVGRMNHIKRTEFLIDVFNKAGAPLKIVGKAGGNKPLEHYQNLAGDNVEVLGPKPWEEVKELYSGCKALVTTSINEDFGLTPVEAMASGKPVLATDEGGHRETVIDGKTGWLLLANKQVFVDKIQEAEQKDLGRMRKACERQAEMFHQDRFFEGLEKAIENLIGEE